MQFKSIVTRYGNNKKTYQIERLDFDRAPGSTFQTKEQEVTFEEYYRSKYGVEIRDRNQPLVIIKSRRSGQEIVLLPELCFMTGLTD